MALLTGRCASNSHFLTKHLLPVGLSNPSPRPACFRPLPTITPQWMRPLKVDLRTMTPAESRALAALLAALPSRQKREMAAAICYALKNDKPFDSSKLQTVT